MNRREFLGAAGLFVALVASRPLKTLAELSPGTPADPAIGTVAMSQGVCPPGWLACDGRTIAEDEYPALHTALGTMFGDRGRRFRVPDLRGRAGVAGGVVSDAIPFAPAPQYLIRAA